MADLTVMDMDIDMVGCETQASNERKLKRSATAPLIDRSWALGDGTRLHDEVQYLNLIRKVVAHGTYRGQERTGMGTLAMFGAMCRYDLSGGKLPLFTTKKVSFGNILKELLFFIQGKSHAGYLSAQGCHIWKGNSTREFLDSRGLTQYPVGQLGPVYGCQWRNFGGDYKGADPQTGSSLYEGYEGVDQLANVVRELQTNPQSRRHIVSAWNPEALGQMALPPCHCLYQFFVDEGNRLKCLMYQRSADLGLGVPYNVASYALLTHIVAHLTGLEASEFIHVMGDHHVYLNHLKSLEVQCGRAPFPFPTVKISSALKKLDDVKPDQFRLENYQHHPSIMMKMAV